MKRVVAFILFALINAITCYCQEINFAEKFNTKRIIRIADRKAKKAIKQNGYLELLDDSIERYYVFRLDVIEYPKMEDVCDYSFLRKASLTYQLNGNLQILPSVEVFFYDRRSRKVLACMNADVVSMKDEQILYDSAYYSCNTRNYPVYYLKNKILEYVFMCPIMGNGGVGDVTFGVKAGKLYTIYREKDWEKHSSNIYCIPAELLFCMPDGCQNIDLKEYPAYR